MKLGWTTDIHLNFLSNDGVESFLTNLWSRSVSGWLISGDIGEATSIVPLLERIADVSDKPVYFVLGNHDFYGDTLDKTTNKVKELVQNKPRLIWLTWDGVQAVSPGVAVVGDDGWGDGRLGTPQTSQVMLNDFVLIPELSGLPRGQLVTKLNQLGDEAASRLAPKLQLAAKANDQVIIVTHVPPFGGAAWHEGQLSDDDWVPWFTCKAIGEALLECAAAYPKVDFLVVCGHTHGSGVYQPSPNLKVLTGGAEYGRPVVNKILYL